MSDDVLVLADGTKINKKTGEVVSDLIVETKNDVLEEPTSDVSEIKQFLVPNKHIKDLPGDINSVRAISVVASLTLFGISDAEIATICNTTHEAIINIKQSERYTDFLNILLENVMNAHSDNIRHLFVRHSRDAALQIIQGMNSQNPDVQYMASKEILDRGGFRPADIVEHRIKHDNDLRIVYIKGEDAPMIEIN